MSLLGLGFVVVQLVNAHSLFQCVLLGFLVLGTLAHSFYCRCSRLLGSRSNGFRGEYQNPPSHSKCLVHSSRIDLI